VNRIGITYRGTIQQWHCAKSMLRPDPHLWDAWPPERAFIA
jgi:hypothetical protein